MMRLRAVRNPGFKRPRPLSENGKARLAKKKWRASLPRAERVIIVITWWKGTKERVRRRRAWRIAGEDGWWRWIRFQGYDSVAIANIPPWQRFAMRPHGSTSGMSGRFERDKTIATGWIQMDDPG